MLETKVRNFLYYIFIAIQFVTVIALASKNKADYMRDTLFIAAFVAVYIIIEDRYKIRVSNYIRGCLMLVITVHVVGGKYFDFYSTSAVFDKVLHVVGIYSFVLFVYSIMDQFLKISFKANFNKFVFITLLGINIGAIFEIVEFFADITVKPSVRNQPDLVDTDLDMVADVIGALIAAFYVCFTDVQLRLSKRK
ncbi:MAG: hypothetical protein A4E55_00792 [Pelotomaculum sp. PtaU1.Bin035]|nr:MAG: hypothetical protein A4E55_00792 [Pelotomaculum sp. PtaU1.Bin035]